MYYLHYDEVSNCPWRKKCIKIENKNNLRVKPKRKKPHKKTNPFNSSYLEYIVKIPEKARSSNSHYSKGN